jgi:hypothetical protein
MAPTCLQEEEMVAPLIAVPLGFVVGKAVEKMNEELHKKARELAMEHENGKHRSSSKLLCPKCYP